MAFAIFKLSYHGPGETELRGGICGTGFFIDRSTAVTARHVLNEETFQPNTGFDYISAIMPQVDGGWQRGSFIIRKANVDNAMCLKEGYIVAHKALWINAEDITLKGVTGFELSFGTRIGMSGGPIIDVQANEVVGMLSMGLPPDVAVKTRSFAISAAEIRKYI